MSTVIHERVEAARQGRNDRVIARMRSGWAVMGDAQFLAGYCLLLPDPVVASLNDLDEHGRAAYLLDMATLGDAVRTVCSPRRVNYEILGNQQPALHAHVIPRYEHEPEPQRTRTIWSYPDEFWSAPEHAYHEPRHRELRLKLRGALEATGAVVDEPDATAASTNRPCPSMNLWQRAASFAARAHRGHLRRDGRTPYFAHPFRVAMLVRDVFGERDPVCLAAAMLHDTIEDTTTDYDDILAEFGVEVADIVTALTKDKRLREDIREKAYDEQLHRAGWRAKLIKLADVMDNWSDWASTGAGDGEHWYTRRDRAIAIASAHKGDGADVLERAVRIVRSTIARGGPA